MVGMRVGWACLGIRKSWFETHANIHARHSSDTFWWMAANVLGELILACYSRTVNQIRWPYFLRPHKNSRNELITCCWAPCHTYIWIWWLQWIWIGAVCMKWTKYDLVISFYQNNRIFYISHHW
jgi:hypothetical protein